MLSREVYARLELYIDKPFLAMGQAGCGRRGAPEEARVDAQKLEPVLGRNLAVQVASVLAVDEVKIPDYAEEKAVVVNDEGADIAVVIAGPRRLIAEALERHLQQIRETLTRCTIDPRLWAQVAADIGIDLGEAPNLLYRRGRQTLLFAVATLPETLKDETKTIFCDELCKDIFNILEGLGAKAIDVLTRGHD